MDNGASSYRRFLSGDDNSMVELVTLYSDSLMLYLNSYVNDIHIAEDLMQEAFIRLAVKKPKYNEKKGSFKTWFYTISRNIAIDYLRKTTNKKSISLDDCPELESASDTEEKLLINERNKELYITLKSIKAEYRQVLYLVFFEEFDNNEIAKIFRKNKRQIENLLYNAKKALKSELERRGFEYEKL